MQRSTGIKESMYHKVQWLKIVLENNYRDVEFQKLLIPSVQKFVKSFRSSLHAKDASN